MAEIKNKKKYEIAFMLKTEDSSLVPQILKKSGFVVLTESSLTKIRAAYFGYCHFEAAANAIKDLNSDLTLKPEILRFLIITPPFVKREAAKKFIPPERSEKVESALPEPALTNEALEKKIKELL